MQEAEACAEPGPAAADAVVTAWPPPKLPWPVPVALAFALVPGPEAEAPLCAR
jgi:hypothetical protein